MKKLFKKIIFLLPIPIFMVAINFLFDPAHLYTMGAYEKGIANYLLEGKNVANVTNHDTYLLQKYYVQGLAVKIDIITVGSSRSLSLKSELFTPKTFFNNSINGARLEDYEYVYRLYKDKKLIPKTIIIGLDPWILYKNKDNLKDTNGSSIIIAEAHQVLDIVNKSLKIDLTLETMNKYYQLISPSYFQNSFSLFTKYLSGKKNELKYFPVDNPSDPRIFRYADGSINYNPDKLDKQKLKEYALTYDPVPLLGGFEKLDEGLINRFQSFVDELQSDQVEVIFYLPPFHPLTYDNLINSHYRIIVDAQKYFVDFAQKRGINVYGSYNPNDYQLKESYFTDGIHPTTEAAAVIFKDMK